MELLHDVVWPFLQESISADWEPKQKAMQNHPWDVALLGINEVFWGAYSLEETMKHKEHRQWLADRVMRCWNTLSLMALLQLQAWLLINAAAIGKYQFGTAFPCQAVKSGGERGTAEGRCVHLRFRTYPGVSLQTRVAICWGSVDQLSAADNIKIYKCYLTKE